MPRNTETDFLREIYIVMHQLSLQTTTGVLNPSYTPIISAASLMQRPSVNPLINDKKDLRIVITKK